MIELAGDELGGVDDVRADVAERARTGLLLVEAPGQRGLGSTIQSCRYWARTWRMSPSTPVAHESARERERRHAAVAEADHRHDAAARRPRGRPRPSRSRLVDRVGERLLAQHVLAGGERGERDLGVAVAGRADVDDVDVVALDDLAPVGRGLLPSPTVGGGLGALPASRPTMTAISRSRGSAKKRGATRQACEWAGPMNPVPIMATRNG